MFLVALVCLFVCLSVCGQQYSKHYVLANVDLNLLLHGGQILDYCQNRTIIESVELYFLETKRLL